MAINTDTLDSDPIRLVTPTKRSPWPLIFSLGAIGMIAVPSDARANAPNFFLLGTSFFMFAMIPVTIAIESLAIRWLFSLTWLKSLLISSTNYFVSTILGTIIWGGLSGFTLIFLMDASNAATVFVQICIFSMINASIETIVLIVIFKITMHWRSLLAFFAVNFITTGLVFLPSFFY